LKSVGFDAAIDYKHFHNVESMRGALAAATPSGIDCYFDNTGGHVTDAAFDLLNKFGRVAICGLIAQGFDATFNVKTINIVRKSLTVRGFVVSDFDARAAEFYEKMTQWIAGGQIKVHETVTDGFERLPEALFGLFTGANIGKAVVKV